MASTDSTQGSPEQKPHRTPPNYEHYQRRRRKQSSWWIPLAIIGVIVVGMIAVGTVFFMAISDPFEANEIDVKSNTVLSLSASGAVGEVADVNPFAFLGSSGNNGVNLFNTLSAIERAKTDDDIRGIYFRAGGIQAGFSKLVELRDALIDFRSSGKFVYAYIEFANESDYFLATAADSVFMATEGFAEMNGFGSVGMFLEGAFDKIGIDYHVVQFEEYKSAGEIYSRTGYSDEARTQIRDIIDQRYGILLDAISETRGMSRDEAHALMSRGIYTPDSMASVNFVDGLLSETTLKQRICDRINADLSSVDSLESLRTISLRKYINAPVFADNSKVNEDINIAIIFGSGVIETGEANPSPFGGSDVIASETFSDYIRSAREDDDVDAVLIRIDSPGGSATASDVIWHEIVETRKVKPVYCSMSDLAASGGYYIAMACDSIFAHESTITGSIGVIMSVPQMTELFDKVGVTFDTVLTSKSALFLNPAFPIDSLQEQKLNSIGGAIYNRFLERAAESRNKSYDEMRSLAKGRVWTGRQALEHGLIDGIADFSESIEIVKRSLGVPEGEKVLVSFYPRPQDSFSAFLRMLDIEEEAGMSAEKLAVKYDEFSTASALGPYREAWKMMPASVQQQFKYMLQINQLASSEHAILALPHMPVIE